MNECNVAKDLMTLCADDAASPDSAEFIRRHTERCPGCRDTWQRIRSELPDAAQPAEDPEKYKKGLRRSKWKNYLKGFVCCLIVVAISAGFLAYQLYLMGFHPVSASYPSPDGSIEIQVVQEEDIRPFYPGDGIMVRFKLNEGSGGLNRYTTDWETLSVHWADDSVLVVLDVVTVEGDHALFITDATIQYHQGGLMRIPGMTEDLVPLLTEAAAGQLSFAEISFTFDTWQSDCQTAVFRFTTDSGTTGTISYHYPTDQIGTVLISEE